MYGIDEVTPGYSTQKSITGNPQKELIITGWAMKADEDTTYANRKVLLLTDAGECYALNTAVLNRGLTEFFNTGYNYDYGGIIAACLLDSLPKEKFHVAYLIIEQNEAPHLIELDTVVDLSEEK